MNTSTLSEDRSSSSSINYYQINGLKLILELATALGLLIFFLCFVKVVLYTVKIARLYVISQWCSCGQDIRKRYGQWAVITGATDGIGFSVAKEFAKRGLSLIIIGRDETRLDFSRRQLEELIAEGAQVVTIKADLSDASEQNFEHIRNQLDLTGREIGVLVNNAGTNTDKLVVYHKQPDQCQWNVLNVNIVAPVRLAKMVLPGMVSRRRGLIVNVSSQLGLYPVPYLGLYGPSKTCINAFSKALRWEYSSVPIDIVNWSPGAVRTKLLIPLLNNPNKVKLFTVDSDCYAESAVNALSTRISHYIGTFKLEIMDLGFKLAECVGLLQPISKIILYLTGKADTSPYDKML